jgi:hypothetical protein
MMRFRGGGVGHKSTREATDFFKNDTDRLDTITVDDDKEMEEPEARQVELETRRMIMGIQDQNLTKTKRRVSKGLQATAKMKTNFLDQRMMAGLLILTWTHSDTQICSNSQCKCFIVSWMGV